MHGYLHEYLIDREPCVITYWRGRLWTALNTTGQVAELSSHGTLERTWTLPDPDAAAPLQIAASRGAIWTTGATASYEVNPDC